MESCRNKCSLDFRDHEGSCKIIEEVDAIMKCVAACGDYLG